MRSNYHQSNKEVSIKVLVSATGIGTFMGALDGSIVNISLATIQNSFQVGQNQTQWIVLSYLLAIIALMTVGGNLGDFFSNKLVFQFGMGIFVLGSFLSGLFSFSIEYLIFFRLIQAIGATGMLANGIAIITRFTSSKNRGLAIGWNSLIVSSALTLGPILGGYLTELFGWEVIFLINVPIGLLGLFWVQFAIPPTPPIRKISSKKDGSSQIDIMGLILFPTAIILLTLSITVLGTGSLLEMIPITTILFLASVITFILLYYFEQKPSNTKPNIDFSLFKNKRFTAGIISAMLAFGGLQTIFYQMPFFLQDKSILGLSQGETGTIFIVVPLVMALSGPIAGRLSDFIDAKYLSTAGMIGIGITLILLVSIISKSIDIPLLIVILILFGLSIGIFSSPNGNSVMSASPEEKLGLSGGLLGLSRNIGFTLGTAFSTSFLFILRNLIAGIGNLSPTDPIVYVSALKWMYLLSIPFVIIAVFISYLRGNEERISQS